MWYALPRSPSCSRNHSRCWANESGIGAVRSTGVIAGASARAAVSTPREKSASTGRSNRSPISTSTPSACRTREITCTASSECPPSAKKWSRRPTRSTPSSSDQIPASASSISPTGAS